MSLPVVTRPAAAAEIEKAHRWYEEEREGLGAEFLEAVDKMVKVIAENPERFPAIRKDIRRAVLRRFPYSIFYRIVSGHVVVICLLPRETESDCLAVTQVTRLGSVVHSC